MADQRLVKALSAGTYHTCTVLDDDKALCFGSNDYGKLGLDSTNATRGTAPGETASSMVQVPQDTSVVAVSAGHEHTCVLLDNGQALCFGSNDRGQLGLDSTDQARGTAAGETASAIVQVPHGSSVVSLSAGNYHTCMVLLDGRALCFGDNGSGRLGLDTFDFRSGTAAGDTASAIVQVPQNTTVVSVSAGDVHTCLVLLDGRALCFGNNYDGQLGLDSSDITRGLVAADSASSIVKVPQNTSVVSVSASHYHTCLVLLDGRALCFGHNGDGRLGLDSTATNRGRAAGETASSIVQVPQNTTVVSVSAGGAHTCVVLDNGQALCFGKNGVGQLGLDSTDSERGTSTGDTASSIVQVPQGASVVTVFAGGSHTCVVLDDGRALCFGFNGSGQLGLDNTDQTRGTATGQTASSIVQVPLIPSTSATPSFTPSSSTTGTSSPSHTGTPSWSPTGTPSPSSSSTGTPSWSPTATPSPSPTGTPSPSPTGTPSPSHTGTPSWSPTATPSSSSSNTPSWSPTATPSSSSTGTPSPSPSHTGTQSPSTSAAHDPSPMSGPLGAAPAGDDDASLSPGPIAAVTLVGVVAVGAGAVLYTRRRTGARRSARAVPPPPAADAAQTTV